MAPPTAQEEDGGDDQRLPAPKRRKLSHGDDDPAAKATNGMQACSPPLMHLFQNHKEIFEGHVLKFLSDDPKAFMALSKTNRGLYAKFNNQQDDTWNIILNHLLPKRKEVVKALVEERYASLLKEEEAERESRERRRSEQWNSDDEESDYEEDEEGSDAEEEETEEERKERLLSFAKSVSLYNIKDKRLHYLEDKHLSSPFDKIWCGQVAYNCKEELSLHPPYRVIYQEFEEQFGNGARMDLQNKLPKPDTFRQMWLMPMATTVKLNRYLTMEIVFTDGFTECFSKLLESNIRKCLKQALECARHRLQAHFWADSMVDSQDMRLMMEMKPFCKCVARASRRVDLDFPMPYNHRLVRHVATAAGVLRMSSYSMKLVWKMMIELSLVLLNIMIAKQIGKYNSDKERRWQPGRKDLKRAAEKVGLEWKLWSKKALEDYDTWGSLDFKSHWKRTSLDEKKEMFPQNNEACKDKDESTDESSVDCRGML